MSKSDNRYLKSYSSLSLLKQYYNECQLRETILSDITDINKRKTIETLFKTMTGLYVLGFYKPENIDQFITNRYFQESLEIDLLLSADLFHSNLSKYNQEVNKVTKHAQLELNKILEKNRLPLVEVQDQSENKKLYSENLNNDLYISDFLKNTKLDHTQIEVFINLHKFAVSCLKLISLSGSAGELYNANSLFTEKVKADLEQNGYAIIENVLSDKEVDDLKNLILKIASRERENGSAYLYGGSDKCQRIYNLLNKHEKFRDLIQRPLILEIMEQMFARNTFHDKYILSSWHSNIIGGGGEASILHLDSAVPEPIPPWMIRININYMLDDFTAENGATLCLPGSHKFCRKPLKEDQNRNDLIPMLAKKGSLGIWNGHLWHKSGKNNTSTERIALLGCFAASHLREMALEEDHLRVIAPDLVEKMTPKLQRLIGVGYGVKKGAQQRHPELQDL